jgi:membrane protease YdiL (CAAX protease family)
MTRRGTTIIAPESDHPTTKATAAIVWLLLLPASGASGILYRVLFAKDPSVWLGVADVAILALLLVLACAITAWRPLRGYLLSLVAFAVGSLIVDGMSQTVASFGWMARMFANTFLQLIPCALLAISLIGSGLTRRDVFLARGNMVAPSRMPRWLPPVRWSWLGPLLTLVLAGGLALQLTLTVHPDLQMYGRVLHGLPLALGFSVVNAAQEEFRFRAVLLGRLLPLVGTTHALLWTSLLFGLAHWFGHPSGPSGVLLAGFAGYVWGRSMIDTRGSAWAWLIHGAQDVVIFAFLIMSNG